MATKSDRYLILASDPDDVQWTILLETENADEALDYWTENKGDPSVRIFINTGDYITFDPNEVKNDGS